MVLKEAFGLKIIKRFMTKYNSILDKCHERVNVDVMKYSPLCGTFFHLLITYSIYTGNIYTRKCPGNILLSYMRYDELISFNEVNNNNAGDNNCTLEAFKVISLVGEGRGAVLTVVRAEFDSCESRVCGWQKRYTVRTRIRFLW